MEKAFENPVKFCKLLWRMADIISTWKTIFWFYRIYFGFILLHWAVVGATICATKKDVAEGEDIMVVVSTQK